MEERSEGEQDSILRIIHISLHAVFCCHLLTVFSKLVVVFFSKNSFRNTIRVSNGLDPNCLQVYQQTTKVTTGKERVNNEIFLKSPTDLRGSTHLNFYSA